MSSQQWDHCLNCNSTIIPPNTPVMYSGPICQCQVKPQWQRPASKEQQFKINDPENAKKCMDLIRDYNWAGMQRKLDDALEVIRYAAKTQCSNMNCETTLVINAKARAWLEKYENPSE